MKIIWPQKSILKNLSRKAMKHNLWSSERKFLQTAVSKLRQSLARHGMRYC